MNKFRSWGYLQTVLAVAAHGSYRAAGEELGISSSTVTRHIDLITAEIGEPVFVPNGRGRELTKAGKELVAIADDTQAKLGFMLKDFANKDGFHGALKLSTLSFINSEFLAPKFHLWQNENPMGQLTLDGSDRSAAVEKGEADVALRLMRPETPGIARFKLANCPVGIFDAGDGENEEWIGLPEGLDHLPEMQFAISVFGINPAIRLDTFRAIAQAAVSTGHACILPTCIAQGFPDLTLRQDGRSPQIINRELWFLFYEKRKNDVSINAARNWVKQVFPSPNKCLCGSC